MSVNCRVTDPSIYLSLCVSVHLSISVCVHLSLSLCVCVCVCSSIYLSVSLFIYLCVCVYVHLSLCVCLCSSIYLSVCVQCGGVDYITHILCDNVSQSSSTSLQHHTHPTATTISDDVSRSAGRSQCVGRSEHVGSSERVRSEAAGVIAQITSPSLTTSTELDQLRHVSLVNNLADLVTALTGLTVCLSVCLSLSLSLSLSVLPPSESCEQPGRPRHSSHWSVCLSVCLSNCLSLSQCCPLVSLFKSSVLVCV